MKKVKFLFGIHCHQPIGNFEHIFDEAYKKCYLPFIELMDKHPGIKFSAHYSGILYDWFLEKHPEFIDYLKKLVKRGQMEIISAGYYEPIIPIIPDEDKIGQIAMHNNFIKEKFGVAPRGLWLTERIWEPHLPKVLKKTGIEYITVDDYHFISAGVPLDKLSGYYVTEEEGSILKIFPINKNLRYLIPFKLPEETIRYLESIASTQGNTAAILADDGEKFGVWPGTHKWVYEEGYLERLLTMLEENSSWIEPMTFSEYLDAFPPLGRIYLPTGSYFEMMEWSLPTDAGKKLENITKDIKQQGKFEEYSQFFKGGFFRNFLVKYPEANNMHKKMLQVSQKLGSLKLNEAQIELYKGQCNCAYWHGVFGGIYLNYLRHAVYEHLIKAETIIDKHLHKKDNYAEISINDFDKDGHDEVILSNNLLNLYFAPAYGGSLFELDYKPKYFNLINTLARREEVYHSKIRAAAYQPSNQENAGATTIHEIVKVKEKGLEEALDYDWHRRISLLDHFLDEDTNLDNFSRVKYHEAGDFTIEPYEFTPQQRDKEASLLLSRLGNVKNSPVKVEKKISILAGQPIIQIVYEITNLSNETINLWFGVEFNFSLLAGKAEDRYYEFPGINLEDTTLASKGILASIKDMKIVDKWSGLEVSFQLSQTADLWRFPIETVSQSETGFEKTYQSSVVFPNWKFTLGSGVKWTTKILLNVKGG